MSIFPSFPLLPFFNFPPRWWFTRKSRGSIRNGNRRWLPEPRPRSVKLAAADSYLLPRSGVLHCEIDSFITEGRRERGRERKREKNRATMYPIPAGQDCVSLKKTARVAFTACHLLATRNRATSRFFFFFFLILIILASTLIAIALKENALEGKEIRETDRF